MINILMVPYGPYGSLLSWIHLVLDPSCPGSLLSWIHFVLVPFCPWSLLSLEKRSERSALIRKYRGWTLAMEWHWQRTKFPAKRTTNEKKNRSKNGKNVILRGFWVEVGPNWLSTRAIAMKFYFLAPGKDKYTQI